MEFQKEYQIGIVKESDSNHIMWYYKHLVMTVISYLKLANALSKPIPIISIV